jgi:hypothetical protein
LSARKAEDRTAPTISATPKKPLISGRHPDMTMPLLGEKPPMRTDEVCWAWADQQAKDEEIAFMWGILDVGNSDRAVACGG